MPLVYESNDVVAKKPTAPDDVNMPQARIVATRHFVVNSVVRGYVCASWSETTIIIRTLLRLYQLGASPTRFQGLLGRVNQTHSTEYSRSVSLLQKLSCFDHTTRDCVCGALETSLIECYSSDCSLP